VPQVAYSDCLGTGHLPRPASPCHQSRTPLFTPPFGENPISCGKNGADWEGARNPTFTGIAGIIGKLICLTHGRTYARESSSRRRLENSYNKPFNAGDW